MAPRENPVHACTDVGRNFRTSWRNSAELFTTPRLGLCKKDDDLQMLIVLEKALLKAYFIVSDVRVNCVVVEGFQMFAVDALTRNTDYSARITFSDFSHRRVFRAFLDALLRSSTTLSMRRP